MKNYTYYLLLVFASCAGGGGSPAAADPSPPPCRADQCFDTDPGWTRFNNPANGNDFGFHNSNLAGGTAGEAGGFFSLTNVPVWYGDESIGDFGANDALSASGILNTVSQDRRYNNNVLIGHFDSGSFKYGAANGIGFMVLERGTQGRNREFRIFYVTGTGSRRLFTIYGLDLTRNWSYTYDPSAGRFGSLTVSISGPGGRAVTYFLLSNERNSIGNIDTFGLVVRAHPNQVNTAQAEIYVDNLSYTSATVATIDAKTSQAGAQTEMTFSGDINAELLKAAGAGNTTKVKQLLGQGADANAEDKYGRNARMIAEAFGHNTIVNILKQAEAQDGSQAVAQAGVSSSREINAELLKAAGAGNTAKVEQLLTQGVDVNARTDYGFTALMSAAQRNHTGTVEILIDAGADVNLKNKDDFTALMYAASRGYTGTVKALMDAGANANVQAALGLAAGYGRTETVKTFIEAGVDVNAKHKSRVPLLSWAARRGHTETVKALIDAGADVNRKHTTGWTALMFASYGGYTETAKVLIDAGADVNAKNNSGQTALMFAAETDHTEIVEILKRAGARR